MVDWREYVFVDNSSICGNRTDTFKVVRFPSQIILNLQLPSSERTLGEAGRQNSASSRVDTFGRSLYLLAFFMRGLLQ